MAQITLDGKPVNTVGSLPEPGAIARDFTLVKSDMSPISLSEFRGQRVVLNIFPSLDTSTCAASVRRFNREAASLDNTVVICISADLPFAASRFCTTEGLDRVYTGSIFRNRIFGRDYGVAFEKGTPVEGLLSRAVVVIDEEGVVLYREQVPEISHEPDYKSALAVLN